MQGDSETAESYRIIAESLEQKMHAKLEDFIYVKPKPQKAAAVDDDEPY